MFQRLLPILLAIVHAASWLAAGLTLGKLEGPYPDHFDISGKPDSWTGAGWWLLPLIAFFMTAFFVGIVFLARRLTVTSPQWVNVPRKREWLALPAEARLRTMKPVEALLLGFALFMNLTFVSVTLDSYAVATGAAAGLSIAKMIVVLACMAVWLVLSILRVRQAIGDEVRAQRQGESPAQAPQRV